MHRDFLIHAKLCTFLSTNKMHFGDMRVKRYLSKKKKQNVELFYELFYSWHSSKYNCKTLQSKVD